MSTTDPGMEDAIASHADKLEQADSDGVNEDHTCEICHTREEADDLRDPSRYWFMSTACPLIAGTFGPIANGFSILALVYEWRVYIPPGSSESQGITMADPAWLIAVNAVSLVAALVANASLMLNMARRLRFSIAQPITVAGFILSSLLLIADIAAMVASPTYWITYPPAIPDARHALSSAFYYGIFAAGIYMIIAFFMCLTVYGANAGFYEKDFKLTTSQRTLMLQTMSFVAYLLLGALVFSHIEGWEYLNSVYWADVTLLTVGLGDYSPSTHTGRSLLFPFAIGGILIVGLVVGSIRTLVLERGEEKLSARITEKRRDNAIHHINERKQVIRISTFSRAEFSTDPSLTLSQRRKEEFIAMRKVQAAAERERRYMALTTSGTLALILWLAGAAIFMRCEYEQKWTYFDGLYFAYTSLLTIGYGDLLPASNSGKPFFVLWSLLSVPALTILISNMGDTIVKWFSDLTIWVGAITVLPDESGFRAGLKTVAKRMRPSTWNDIGFQAPGIFGDMPHSDQRARRGFRNAPSDEQILDRLAERLSEHLDDMDDLPATASEEERQKHDIDFYHYVLARETRDIQRTVADKPDKRYAWDEWEYYLRLMGRNEANDPEEYPGQKHPNILVPGPLRVNTTHNDSEATNAPVADQAEEKKTKRKHIHKRENVQTSLTFSWLSAESPLLGTKSESQWILDRLSAALERELNRTRKGFWKRPPIAASELREHLLRARERMKEEARGVNDDVDGKENA